MNQFTSKRTELEAFHSNGRLSEWTGPFWSPAQTEGTGRRGGCPTAPASRPAASRTRGGRQPQPKADLQPHRSSLRLVLGELLGQVPASSCGRHRCPAPSCRTPGRTGAAGLALLAFSSAGSSRAAASKEESLESGHSISQRRPGQPVRAGHVCTYWETSPAENHPRKDLSKDESRDLLLCESLLHADTHFSSHGRRAPPFINSKAHGFSGLSVSGTTRQGCVWRLQQNAFLDGKRSSGRSRR